MTKGWTNKLKLVLLFPIVAFLTMGVDFGCGEIPDPSDFVEIPEKEPPPWDTDGDCISTAVETNNANSYLNLNPDSADDNPTLACGWPCSTYCTGTDCGYIENALNMVNTGTGYYHYNPEKPEKIDTDDWATLHLINMIEGAGRNWYNNYRVTPRIGVGDLSKGDAGTEQFGGYFYPHVCHQNGTEVDIRYVRNDGNELPLNIGSGDSIYYSLAGTVTLMKYLFKNSKSIKIIVSPHCRITFSGIVVKYDSGWHHDDHFHLRIEDPDGTGD